MKKLLKMTETEGLNKDCVEISRPYLLYNFQEKKPSKSVTVGTGRAGSLFNFK